ncbi:hypothetical protein C8R42DRAFT_223534 [Lentinula raphanica]|nr:hypothetical protein C8R42DRAFT_223534 [Lentinula raphanica]
MKAVLDGVVLAESDDTKVIEGNYYFPPETVKKEYFTDSNTSDCSYYDATIGGKKVPDVAWYYPNTISERAKPIENYVAFYKVSLLALPTLPDLCADEYSKEQGPIRIENTMYNCYCKSKLRDHV